MGIVRKVKIGLVQMRMGHDRNVNLSRAQSMIREAADRGAEIVCLPELFNSPYFPREQGADAPAETIPGHTIQALSLAAKESRVILIGGSIYEAAGGRKYNTSVVFDSDGSIISKYRKVHIPQDAGFYEKDYFAGGRSYTVVQTGKAGIGVLICFDQWFPEAARMNRLMGAEILFYPTAIGTVEGVDQSEGNWQEAWEGVQRGHAIANSMVVAAVNRVGREGGTSFWGGSFIYDQFGTLIVRADDSEQVVVAECDLDLGRDVEEGWGFMKNRRPETYGKLSR